MTEFHLVGYAMVQRADHVLFARRHQVSYAEGHWGFPGGHVEAGETFAEATAREVAEEVGLHIDAADLVPVGMWRYAEQDVSGLDVYFTARRFSGEPRPLAECDAVRWARPGELPQPVVPWVPAALDRHLTRGIWFADLANPSAGPRSGAT